MTAAPTRSVARTTESSSTRRNRSSDGAGGGEGEGGASGSGTVVKWTRIYPETRCDGKIRGYCYKLLYCL
jgi:hypothetical protein